MSDSDAPYFVILFYHTWSVLVICKSNSKNSRPAPFIFKYPQWCSPKVKINFRFKFSCLIIPFSTSLSFSHQKGWISSKFQWIIFAKVISYHFWSNRARTLRPHHLLLHWLFPIESRESIHSSTGTCLYSWPNSMTHWTFPSPLSFLLALPMSHAISIFWLYTGEITVWVKVPISWTKIYRVFLRCTPRENCTSFSANPTSIGWSRL